MYSTLYSNIKLRLNTKSGGASVVTKCLIIGGISEMDKRFYKDICDEIIIAGGHEGADILGDWFTYDFWEDVATRGPYDYIFYDNGSLRWMFPHENYTFYEGYSDSDILKINPYREFVDIISHSGTIHIYPRDSAQGTSTLYEILLDKGIKTQLTFATKLVPKKNKYTNSEYIDWGQYYVASGRIIGKQKHNLKRYLIKDGNSNSVIFYDTDNMKYSTLEKTWFFRAPTTIHNIISYIENTDEKSDAVSANHIKFKELK